MHKHIVQSGEWQKIKTEYGTEAIRVGDIFYTKHAIPKTKYFFAYCPRVNPMLINFEKLKKSLKENSCIALTFDVPNVFKGTDDEKKAVELFSNSCKKSKRSEFAKANVILDLSKSERELFEEMKKKHRYNIRYAAKNGVTVELGKDEEDFDTFFKLFKDTAFRQKFFLRPKKYYQLIWNTLHPKEMCHILTAYYKGEPLASWMVFIYENVLYYPYGGSSLAHRNVFASNALGWEAIRLGKRYDCTLFDMWGAAEDPEDLSDSYHGFTNFKIKFGGEHVQYIDSYDLIINRPMYLLFTFTNELRWKLLEMGLIK
ncbi:lipid II:glycine glycyltransferase FemX [Patescibacteria group bacterium]